MQSPTPFEFDLTLPGTNVRATRLGFGCGRLMRMSSHNDRKNAVAAALDAGIRYFDVAPMYGMGSAEAELARCLGSRRHEVTISTKFGIESRRGAINAGFVQTVARTILNAIPPLKRIVKRHSHMLYKARRYDAGAAKSSLESSLAALGVDRIGVLLAHEPTSSELTDPALVPWLESMRGNGVIGSWGIAGESKRTAEVAAQFPQLAHVLQFDCDALHRQIEYMPDGTNRAMVTFSPLLESYGLVRDKLASGSDLAKRWSALIGDDFSQPDTASHYLLAYAVHANPRGIVLYSSGSAKRIMQAVRWVREDMPDREAMGTFLELLAEAFPLKVQP